MAPQNAGFGSEVMCHIMVNFSLKIVHLFWRIVVTVTENLSSHNSHFGIHFSLALVALKHLAPCRTVDGYPGRNFRVDVTIMDQES